MPWRRRMLASCRQLWSTDHPSRRLPRNGLAAVIRPSGIEDAVLGELAEPRTTLHVEWTETGPRHTVVDGPDVRVRIIQRPNLQLVIVSLKQIPSSNTFSISPE